MAKIYNGVGTRVARMPELNPAIGMAAKSVASKARAMAAVDADTGDFAGSISAEPYRHHRDTNDWAVVMQDEGASFIEAGHISQSGTYVPGKMTGWRAAGGVYVPSGAPSGGGKRSGSRG